MGKSILEPQTASGKPDRRGALTAARIRIAVVLLIVVLNIPARLLYILKGLWLDEAWVGNSILVPTVKQMLFYDRWVQSTPPLTLLLMRGAVWLLGPGEVSFRAVFLVAGLVALVVFAIVSDRLFDWPFSLLATTFLATNYWAIRYSQEAKQYACDLFVATVFILLVHRILSQHGGPSGLLVFTVGLIGSIVSLPAVFFFPGFLIALQMREVPTGARFWSRLSLRPILVGAALAGGLIAQYLLFWRPNITGSFRAGLADYSEAAEGPAAVLGHFLANLAELLLPTTFPFSRVVSLVLPMLVGVGVVRSIAGAFKADSRSFLLVLTGVLPPVTAVVLSFWNLYPVVPHPRLILWMLPCCTILMFAALEVPFHAIASRIPAFVVQAIVVPSCVIVTISVYAVLVSHPRSVEDNRAAVSFLAGHAQPGDGIFVHGGMSEQFTLYTRLLAWTPPAVYLANADWPCCNINRENRVSNPQAKTMQDDVESALKALGRHWIWVVSPSGNPLHWSGMLGKGIAQIPIYLRANGCVSEEVRLFGFTQVSRFNCGAPAGPEK